MTSAQVGSPPAARTSRRRDPVVPTQHGAWGFLLLPVVLGIEAGGWEPRLVPVVLAWVALYPLSWALTNVLAAPRPERFRKALTVWAAIGIPLVLVSVWVHPWLVWVGLVYLVPFTVNVRFARARRERDPANDLVLILECTAAVPVVAGIAAANGTWAPPWSAMLTTGTGLAALCCALTLIGSTLHVKSLIRERRNPRFTTAARAFALASVPVVGVASVLAGAGLWLVVPFGLLALRAWVGHVPTWRPARLGLIELAGLLLVVGFAAPALR